MSPLTVPSGDSTTGTVRVLNHTDVPVLIGTDAVASELDYAVPPGKWRLVVELHTEQGMVVLLPMPLGVTPAPARPRA